MRKEICFLVLFFVIVEVNAFFMAEPTTPFVEHARTFFMNVGIFGTAFAMLWVLITKCEGNLGEMASILPFFSIVTGALMFLALTSFNFTNGTRFFHSMIIGVAMYGHICHRWIQRNARAAHIEHLLSMP